MLKHLLEHLQQNKHLAMLPPWPEEHKHWSDSESSSLHVTTVRIMEEVKRILTNAVPAMLDAQITMSLGKVGDIRVTQVMLSMYADSYIQKTRVSFIDMYSQPKIDYLLAAIRNQMTDFEMITNSFISSYQVLGSILDLVRAGQAIEQALYVLECVPSHSNPSGPMYPPKLPASPITIMDMITTGRGFTTGNRVVEIIESYDHCIKQSGNTEFALYWESLKNLPGNKKRLQEFGYENNSR